MSARVLVVDDVLANVKLLEAKLTAEYLEVLTALNGPEALVIVEKEQPDIVLLDVMMPGMDGFEVCGKIKSNPKTEHIPVVMVTALDQQSDRVAGIEAGADDFLTKPVNDIALMARVKSLLRLKMMMDEMRMRESTGRSLGIMPSSTEEDEDPSAGGRILVIEEREITARRIVETLGDNCEVELDREYDSAVEKSRTGNFDLIIVSLTVEAFDGLRFCSQIRSMDATRHVPILVLVEEDDLPRLVRALDLGVNDYLMRPVDRNELVARVKTQFKRKRYADQLRTNFHMSLEMAVTDPLTGLHNRRYMMGHLDTLMENATTSSKPLSLLIVDIDFFKAVNDTHGHDAGDVVLKEFANRLEGNVRGVDLSCRFGGEEFVVVMPDTDVNAASMVAERIREQVAAQPFKIGESDDDRLELTISIGVATTAEDGVGDADQLLQRADKALYRAKDEGRNRVVNAAA